MRKIIPICNEAIIIKLNPEADEPVENKLVTLLNEELISEPIQVTENEKTFNQYRINIPNSSKILIINTPEDLLFPVGKPLGDLKIFN